MDEASWYGPPRDVLGRTVPVQQFVVRTGHVVVAVPHLVAFREGCLIVLLVTVRRGGLPMAAWDNRLGGHRAGMPDPEGLTCEIHLRGGTSEPSRLVEAGAESSSDDREYRGELRFWLRPLPPPAPFDLVVAGPGMGVDRSVVTLDGGAVVRAAARAAPFWT
ncbi:hypothetical protein ACWT_4641 [Actinoplanes sp. SE50]|uniref:hypothetical protein n=1 Tax=unclassified Actinoplanes TaxID=2626549 RepID=UPI00023ED641|nr:MULTISPECIES: hypothetical protein [unclassified Actinoplanes]AEV85663.1 hypothetical protein ACPL_4772 [Actinoplanes sp. SE50/110]ATO84056.1 hypothetical protein ACWT_4641 [Actinoplanes sp. SE50]SLM01466.1 uncharacterized protein ACSP50_4702 [Actinoplanes sp. SE50/110]